MAFVKAIQVRGASRLRRYAAALLLLVTAACSGPPELDRPVVSATVSAVSLLPSGRIAPASFPGAVDAAAVATADGGRIIALRFRSEIAAQTGYTQLADRIAKRPDVGARNSVSTGATHYVQYTAGHTSGLAWLSGVWVFSVEAGSPEQVAALIRGSGVGGIPGGFSGSIFGNFVLLLGNAGALIGAGIGILVALLSLFLPGWMLKGQAVAPQPGAPVLSREELVQRLLTLNDEKLPYIVRKGPEADLVVEWKFADAKWWGILAKQGVNKAYRLRLYFDETSHRASALDEFGEVEWSAGLTTAPAVHFQKKFFRGVVLMKRERGVAYGFKTPLGGGFGKMLDYKLDVGWLKNRIIAVIIGLGWTYQPALRPPKR